MALHDDQVMHAEVGLNLPLEKFEAELDRAFGDFKSRVAEVDRSTATAELKLDLVPFDISIKEVKAELKKLEIERAELGVEISKTDKLRILEEMRALKIELKAATKDKLEFEVNLANKQQLLDMEKTLAKDERERVLATRKLEDDRAAAVKRRIDLEKRGYVEQNQAGRLNEQFDRDRLKNIERLYEARRRAGQVAVESESKASERLREGLRDEGRKIGLQRQYKTLLEDTLTKQQAKKPVDLDIKAASAKLALLRFDLERLGADVPVNIKPNIDRSQLSILKNLRQDAGSLFGDVKKFAKSGPDTLPGFGRIPAGAALVGSPILTGLAGGATSLLGAVGGGAAGAGAIGAGIGTGLVTNVLGLARAFDVTHQETHQADQALIHYEETSRKFGSGSLKAQKALAEYTNIINAMTPAAREFSLTLKGAQEQWNKFTKAPIEKDTIRVLRDYSKAIKEFTPGLAANTNETGGIVANRASSFIGRLSKPGNKEEFLSLGKSANTFLNPALIGAEHLLIAFIHIASAAAKIFAGPVGESIKEFGEDFDKAAKPGEHLNEEIRKLGKYAGDTLHVLGAAGKLVVTIFGISAESGDTMLQKMSGALDRWDAHLKTVEGRQGSKNFFKVSAEFLEQLTPLILTAGKLLGTWAAALIPAANTFLEILKVTTEVVNRIGHMIGLNKPLETLGVAVGAIFAASKFQSGVAATGTILSNLKKMDGPLAALKGLFTGDLFKKQNPIVQGAEVGSNIWYENIIKAATEGGAIIQRDMVAGAAAGGKIAGEEEAAGTAGGGLIPGLKGGGPVATVEKSLAPAIEGGGAAALAKSIVPALTRGGLVAGGAYLATQIVGSLIGGSGGKDVSKIGGQAAIGAGIGTVLLPGIGTAVGAAVVPGLVAVANAIKGNPHEHSQRSAHAAHLTDAQTKEVEDIEDETNSKLHHKRAPKAGSAPGFFSPTLPKAVGLSSQEQAEDKEAKFTGEQKQGHSLGASLSKNVLAGREFPNVDSIVRVTRNTLKTLGPVGQQSMLEMVKKMVETLEHEGRVVPGSVRKLRDGVKSALTGMGALGEISGHHFTDQLARSINSHEIQGALSNFTKDLQKRWGPEFGAAINTHDAFGKVIASTHTDLGKLEYEMHHGTQRQKEVATAEYKELHDGIGKYIGNTRSSVESEIDYLNKTMRTRGPKGPEELAKAYRRMREVIEAEVATGLSSVRTGISKINHTMNEELSKLNPKNPGSVAAAGLIGQETGEAAVAIAEGKAQGGLVQFGQSGASGMDNIPVRMMVGSGEVGAVFTKQQQQVANSLLAPVGGLPGLFNSYATPHYMAKGGFTPADAYRGLTRGRVDQGVDFGGAGPVEAIAAGTVRSTGLWHGWPGTGGVVYTTGKGNVYVMEDFAPIVHPGQKVSAGQVIGLATGGPSGIETGWANSAGTAPEIRYNGLPDGTPTTGGKSFSSLLGGANVGGVGGVAQALFKKIATPHAGGHGVIHSIAQAVLSKAAKAANAHLARILGASPGEIAGSLVTASEFGGHNDPSAFGHPTASGKIANDTLMGFAELSNPPSSFNFSALGKLAMGTMIEVSYRGHKIKIPKVDVGQGGAGLGGHTRAIDLTYAAARALHAPGLENVHWRRAARGGLYGQPALLVGEHDNEYVINPRRADNAEYLHAAATDMGYRVTPASHGKKPKGPPPKNVLSHPGDFKELPTLSAGARHHGVPPEVIDPVVKDIEAALKTETTTYAKLGVQEKKALAKLARDKSSAAHSLGQAYARAKLAADNARKSSARTIAGHKRAVANDPTNIVAQLTLAESERESGQKIRKAETSASLGVQNAKFHGDAAVKAAAKTLEDIRKGKTSIIHGGVWHGEKYLPIGKLEHEQAQGRAAEAKLKAFEKHIKSLDRSITNLTHGMNIDANRFSHTKDASTRSTLSADWSAKLVQRKSLIAELSKEITGSKTAAGKFIHDHPHSPHLQEVNAYLETVEDQLQEVEDREDEAAGAEEAGVSGHGSSVSPESFVESLGRTDELRGFEEEYALATTSLVPDNPNTPANEELPGLKGELTPAQKIKTFWESILTQAQGTPGMSPEAITQIANQVTSARSTAFGLASSIEGAEKGIASQAFQESQAFGSARLELYRNFGSNFAPLWTQPGVAGGVGPSLGAGASQKTVNLSVTNHFSHPPANPHIWSNGVAWELGAAI